MINIATNIDFFLIFRPIDYNVFINNLPLKTSEFFMFKINF